MAKIHLIISADPVSNGEDRQAICGETVPKASAIPLTEFYEPSSTILFCKSCFMVLTLTGRKYYYAISSGQEARDIEVEA